MSQVEVSKLVQHISIGPPADEAGVPKIVMYVSLTPGNDGDTPDRQGFCYGQKVRRD